jgi:DNA helicase-2/ATP-dependent DNA helicase PcrA
VRETVRKNLYTGKTYNSVENIHQFFAERGGQATQTQAPQPAQPVAQAPVIRQATKKAIGQGTMVRHPKYGRGRVLRREGDGDDAKLTVEFPGYGLKKLVQKFSGIQVE